MRPKSAGGGRVAHVVTGAASGVFRAQMDCLLNAQVASFSPSVISERGLAEGGMQKKRNLWPPEGGARTCGPATLSSACSLSNAGALSSLRAAGSVRGQVAAGVGQRQREPMRELGGW